MKRSTVLLLTLLGLAFVCSLAAGKVWIGPADWFADNANGWIMAELRLPRAILGACVGAVLGLSGAVLQGYLRNPLADPTVVGVSSSAALGGVIAILLGVSGLAMFGFAMATTILIGQAMGRRDITDVRRTIGAATGLFFTLGVITAVAGWIFAPDVLHLLATPKDALKRPRPNLTKISPRGPPATPSVTRKCFSGDPQTKS
jgi:ABC-type cobalamin transport system permease subunit